MAKNKEKIETKTEKLEREYIIPLRIKWKNVPRYKRANKAIKAIKEFLVRHMKIRDRDLSKIKIDKYLNEVIWIRGIKKPPIKVKVRAVKEGDLVRVESVELPDKLKFKKIRLEKREQKSIEIVKQKKVVEKSEEEKAKTEKTEEEKKEEIEKTKAGEEATKALEKAQAKQIKHQKATIKEPKRRQRKVLAK